LKQVKRKKEGMKYQEVVYYQFKDYEKAKLYKKQLKAELDRCIGLIHKALSDNYK
jgi:Replication terminator protein